MTSNRTIAAALVLALGGCSAETSKGPSAPVQNGPVRLLVIGDAELAAAAESLAGAWRQHGGGTLEVFQVDADRGLAGQGWPEVDAVVFPPAALGVLAQAERIVPLSGAQLAETTLAWGDVFDLLRVRECTWGERTFGVPLGSPVLVLYYRADLLRLLAREPPQTWAEYQSLAELLANRGRLGDLAPPAEAPWGAAAEPLEDEWAAVTLLARAAAYAQHAENYSTLFSIASMEPLIAGPPFVRALDELRAAAKWGLPAAREMGPPETREAFWAGRCAMALTWANPAAKAAPGLEVGVCELPGATEAFDTGQASWEPRSEAAGTHVPLISASGRIGALASGARNPQGAFALLAAMSRENWAVEALRRDEALTMSRRSQMAGAAGWVESDAPPALGPAYAAAVRASLSRSEALAALSIPGRGEYLHVLAEAVRGSLDSPESSEAVLRAVAAAWREITIQRGSDRQLQAYQRSLGILP